MRIIPLDQNTKEWLEFRKTRIGASDASSIMGENIWKTKYQLWEEKITPFHETPVTAAMQRGIDLEPVARQAFIAQTGVPIEKMTVQHDEYDWMIASLDGINTDHKVIVEIKCPGLKDHGVAIEGNIPLKYYAQVQHQLAVTGYDLAYYYSFDGKYGVVVDVERNEEYIAALINAEKAFMECLRTMTPPDKMSREYVEMEDNEEWIETAQAYLEAEEKLLKWEQEVKELRSKLEDIAGGSNASGAGITLQKVLRKGTVDYTKIELLKGLDLEPYRKPSSEAYRLVKKGVA